MSLTVTTAAPPLHIDADGVARVGRTRVTLDTVVAAFEDGATAEEIVQQHPALMLPDVYAVIGYYLRQRDEVAKYMEDRQSQAAAVRQQNETRTSANFQDIRARLLARKKN